jgi:hypothetical protein
MPTQLVDLAPPPLTTDLVVSAKELTITKPWEEYLRARDARIQATASTIVSTSLTGQNASIGLTSLVPAASGVYRVSYRFRITTPAGVASSLQVSVATIEGGVNCTQSSAVYAGNVNNAPQSGSFLVKCDPATPLQYSFTYVSNPAAAMIFDAEIRAEAL